ncbi:MAG: DJ-1/PfpI family protein [Devosia sp.]|jgi:putative intracellular protease/amidase|uniref:DJ-1/PfpI family protein n=1 Tax=unclassified Devosia TaxID=196773 RepID=UPI001A0E943D|nr:MULTISPECIES: DJ-1/PfpI family protein [unclassified Devosia]MBF0678587.1 DJ-1/PfpI family protein [Devosia sp.]WEJ31843.1 DJ-1/PfpI family protein [Devosia sp. SD17-2]
MPTIVTILTSGYADWETALLNAGARQYYRIETMFASPRGEEVTSAGGLKVTPQMAVEDIDLDAVDAIVVNGGSIWSSPDAPDISDLLVRARDAGKTVGGICDGTLDLARAGILDDVAHTSNGPESLPDTGYGGVARYQDQPRAVLDRKIVTAPGTAPVSFMGAVLESMGYRNGDLDFYLNLYAAEHTHG